MFIIGFIYCWFMPICIPPLGIMFICCWRIIAICYIYIWFIYIWPIWFICICWLPMLSWFIIMEVSMPGLNPEAG